MVCPDVPGISRLSRWSDAPASETSVISPLVRLQQASRSDSGSCGGNTVGVQVPPFALGRCGNCYLFSPLCSVGLVTGNNRGRNGSEKLRIERGEAVEFAASLARHPAAVVASQRQVVHAHDPGGALVAGPRLSRAEPRRRSLLRGALPLTLTDDRFGFANPAACTM